MKFFIPRYFGNQWRHETLCKKIWCGRCGTKFIKSKKWLIMVDNCCNLSKHQDINHIYLFWERFASDVSICLGISINNWERLEFLAYLRTDLCDFHDVDFKFDVTRSDSLQVGISAILLRCHFTPLLWIQNVGFS